MAEYIYKVAPRGGGKTRWLLEQAHVESELENPVCLLVNDDPTGSREYQKFVEKYFSIYHEICKVIVAEHITSVPKNSVVLIDNPLNLNKHIQSHIALEERATRIYVAVDGVDSETYEIKQPDSNQLSIFDMEVKDEG